MILKGVSLFASYTRHIKLFHILQQKYQSLILIVLCNCETMIKYYFSFFTFRISTQLEHCIDLKSHDYDGVVLIDSGEPGNENQPEPFRSVLKNQAQVPYHPSNFIVFPSPLLYLGLL